MHVRPVVTGNTSEPTITITGPDVSRLSCNIITGVDVSPCQALVQMVSNTFRQTKGSSADEMDLVELFHETSTLNRSLSDPVEDAFASKDIWVLCNLSKRE